MQEFRGIEGLDSTAQIHFDAGRGFRATYVLDFHIILSLILSETSKYPILMPTSPKIEACARIDT